MDCPKCGAYNETDVGSCLSCGAAFPAEDAAAPTMMKPSAKAPAGRLQQAGGSPKQCPNCMTPNPASFKFCARCGTPPTPSPPTPPPQGARWAVPEPDRQPCPAPAQTAPPARQGP